VGGTLNRLTGLSHRPGDRGHTSRGPSSQPIFCGVKTPGEVGGAEGRRADPYAGQAVDVSYNLQRAEARTILRGFWVKRLRLVIPGEAVLVAVYARTVGPPYWEGILTGLILGAFAAFVVMAIWDQSRLKSLCRPVHVRWSPAGVQVANPQETKQFRWSSVTGCKASRTFLTTTFSDGTAIHVPRRAFASNTDLQQVLGLVDKGTFVDVRKEPG
jgi:hypothetical protein